jgi:quinol monooxygenase YgiN
MSVVVIATIMPADGFRDEVIAAFERAIPPVHANDDGCELYALHEADDRLVMVEKWSSQDALDAHGQNATLATLGREIAGKIVGEVDLQVLAPHPAGTREQGTL